MGATTALRKDGTMKSFLFTLIVSLLLSTSGLAATTNWTIDPAHSSVSFKVKHMMISDVRGSFRDIEGSVVIDESVQANSKIAATIVAASIDTGIDKRDEHLRSADFFDVATYPTLTFASKQIKEITANSFVLIGDLSIHGVTKEVSLSVSGPSAAVEDQWGNLRMAASATTNINRKDFGLTWNSVLETGGVVVADEVRIELDIQIIKQSN
jgi:polyisoprenoid-binding protein YceI